MWWSEREVRSGQADGHVLFLRVGDDDSNEQIKFFEFRRKLPAPSCLDNFRSGEHANCLVVRLVCYTVCSRIQQSALFVCCEFISGEVEESRVNQIINHRRGFLFSIHFVVTVPLFSILHSVHGFLLINQDGNFVRFRLYTIFLWLVRFSSLLVSFCKLDRQASITAFQLLLFQGGHDGRVRSKSAAAVAPTTPFSFSSRAIKATMQKVTGS
ncbi:Oxalate decarboxylase OxdD [Trichinella spiralis]|uniref:Oxalate decarboxylase OxdD n=1 Tax=Trichinella spiralis TaxID=6334 RepID=A0ABR3KZU9_TRISP